MKKRGIALLLGAALAFLLCVDALEHTRSTQGKQQLEEALRRTAVSCYAANGFYPPSVAYMEENWGLRYDRKAYLVQYDLFATNLMPEITVLEK